MVEVCRFVACGRMIVMGLRRVVGQQGAGVYCVWQGAGSGSGRGKAGVCAPSPVARVQV